MYKNLDLPIKKKLSINKITKNNIKNKKLTSKMKHNKVLESLKKGS